MLFKPYCRLITLSMLLAMPLTVTIAQTCNAQYIPRTIYDVRHGSARAPMLPSAATGSGGDVFDQSMIGRAPALQGYSNGTIGPPGMPASITMAAMPPDIKGVPAPSSDKQWIGVIAVAMAALFAFLLGRRKKSCVWALGASTAAIMMIAGLAWGTFGMTH